MQYQACVSEEGRAGNRGRARGAGLEGPSSGVGPAASSNGTALLQELGFAVKPVLEKFVNGFDIKLEALRESFRKVSTKHHVMLL